MAYIGRAVVISVIILLSLVSGAYGELKICASTGDASGSSSYSETLETEINDQIHEHIALSSSELDNDFSGSGNFPKKTYSTKSNAGSTASVGLEIKNALSYSGSYYLSPKTADFALARLSLDVNTANLIKSWAEAKNKKGMTSHSDVSIASGSLNGYFNYACADAIQATTSENAKSASGKSIEFSSTAKNSNDISAKLNAKITSPTAQAYLGGYQNTASVTDNGPDASQGANYASANGGSIYFTGDTKNSVIGRTSTAIHIYNGQIYNPYLNAFALAYSTNGGPNSQWDTLSASSLNGETVYIKSDFSKKGGDAASIDTKINQGTFTNLWHGGWLTPNNIEIFVRPHYLTQPSTLSGDSFGLTSIASNKEGDKASLKVSIDEGTISNPFLYSLTNANSIFEKYSAGQFYENYLQGQKIKIAATAENKEGDKTSTNIDINNGLISNPYLYTLSYANNIEGEFSTPSLSGQPAQITAHAENKERAYDPEYKKYYKGGAADFIVKRNEFTDVLIRTRATSTYVNIGTSEMGKTTLFLEPFKWEMGDLYGKVSLKLADKGYAVTGYSNSGVSWENVDQLDEYTISLINTHSVGTLNKEGHITSTKGLTISKYIDKNTNFKTWAQLQPELSNPNGKNDMLILDACGSFYKNPDGQLSGQDIVQNSKISGGFTDTINSAILVGGINVFSPNLKYMDTFFTSLCDGDSVDTANNKAMATNDIHLFNRRLIWTTDMTLQGDKTYTLP